MVNLIQKARSSIMKNVTVAARELHEVFGRKEIAPGVRKVSHATGEMLYFFRISIKEWYPDTFSEKLEKSGLLKKYSLSVEMRGFDVYLLPPNLRCEVAPFVSFTDSSNLILRFSSALAHSVGIDWDSFARDLNHAFVV